MNAQIEFLAGCGKSLTAPLDYGARRTRIGWSLLFIWAVWFGWLVERDKPNEQDRPDELDQPSPISLVTRFTHTRPLLAPERQPPEGQDDFSEEKRYSLQ